MAIEHEMAAGAGAIEAANDIRHRGMGRDDAVGQASLFQEGGDEFGGVARVARGIGATVLDEGLQEMHKIVAVAIDPIEQLLTRRGHDHLLAQSQFPGLVTSPAIADAGRQRNICHSRKTANTPAAAGRTSGTGTDGGKGAVATMKALPKSLWAATATPASSYPRLDGEHAADCVIVGGGFTGLSTALHLADRGLKAVLVEANEPGWGASGRNGGQVIPGLKLDPSEMRAKYGEERGRRLTATVGATADLVFDLIERHGIACNAKRTGWIQAAPGPKGLAEVR